MRATLLIILPVVASILMGCILEARGTLGDPLEPELSCDPPRLVSSPPVAELYLSDGVVSIYIDGAGPEYKRIVGEAADALNIALYRYPAEFSFVGSPNEADVVVREATDADPLFAECQERATTIIRGCICRTAGPTYILTNAGMIDAWTEAGLDQIGRRTMAHEFGHTLGWPDYGECLHSDRLMEWCGAYVGESGWYFPPIVPSAWEIAELARTYEW